MFNKIKSMFKEDSKKSEKKSEKLTENTHKSTQPKRDSYKSNQTRDKNKKNKKNTNKKSDKSDDSNINKTSANAQTIHSQKSHSEEKEKSNKAEQNKKDAAKEERNWPDQVKAIVIVELMGTPEEHIKNTMQLYLERIKENKDMLVEDEHLEPIEKKESFFLQFTELTITFKSVKNLIEFCFDYMPSSIEIIEPTHITYNSQDLSDIINDLQAKLHQLDMIVKNLRTENKVLNDNGNLLLRNLILVALKEELSMDALVKTTGINKEAVEKFVDALIEGKLVEEKKGKYRAKNHK